MATNATTRDQVERLTETVLRPLTSTGRGYWAVVGLLLIVVAWGLFAYARQLGEGLIVTGMRDQVVWGFYIVNFIFFIGISHAGTLTSAILRLSGAEWRRPITRMAEVITVVALMMGAVMPIVDLGRPDRIYNLIIHGRMQSPVIWDLFAITTYLTGSLIYLYLPLIPDIASCRDRLTASSARWRHRLYAILAMGWRGRPEQRRRLNRAIGVMAIIIIPVAVSAHTVVAWIFAMTLRSGWNSTIFGPYFVLGAVFSGVASIIIVIAIFRKLYHLEAYITQLHFRYLGYLLLTLALLYVYFALNEYLTVGYKLQVGDKPLLEALFVGEFAPYFWLFAIGGLIVPILLIALPPSRTIPGIVTAAVLVNIGMWLKRFVIVIPSLGLPLMPYEWGVYRPTWVEWSILAATFAGFALLFALFAKLFPLISVWEVEEGLQKKAAAAPAEPSAEFGRLAPPPWPRHSAAPDSAAGTAGET